MATYSAPGDYIKSSIRGRRCGLDNNEVISGPTGYRRQTEYLTSGDGAATMMPSGVTGLNATASSSFAITPPSAAMVGVEKIIVSLQAVTNKIGVASGAFLTSTGSAAATTITSTGIGQALTLFYATTGVILVRANQGAMTFA